MKRSGMNPGVHLTCGRFEDEELFCWVLSLRGNQAGGGHKPQCLRDQVNGCRCRRGKSGQREEPSTPEESAHPNPGGLGLASMRLLNALMGPCRASSARGCRKPLEWVGPSCSVWSSGRSQSILLSSMPLPLWVSGGSQAMSSRASMVHPVRGSKGSG